MMMEKPASFDATCIIFYSDINYNKFNSLKQQKCIILQFYRLEVQ